VQSVAAEVDSSECRSCLTANRPAVRGRRRAGWCSWSFGTIIKGRFAIQSTAELPQASGRKWT